MKRILVLSLIVLCKVSFAKAQDIVNLRMDRQQMGLRGLVATMDEDILLRKDYFREDWPERKWFVKDLRNVLREDDGRILTFNTAGHVTSITYTQQGKPGKKTSCSYASNGLLSSYLGEGYKVKAKYSGSSADINVYAETKNYKSVNLAKADLNTTPYSNSYPFDLKCRQELTDDGLVLKSSYFYVDSVPAKVCEYNYNHLNLLTSEKVTDYSSGEKEVTTTQYTYDNQNYLIKKVIRGRAVDETWTYENNDLGDCTKLTVERPYGTVVYTFDYVYDTLDNWTVRLQFEDGVFDNAALRTLTYHKSRKAKPEKEAAAVEKAMTKDAKAAAKADAKAAKQEAKEAAAHARAEAKAEKEAIREAEKNMSKVERKAAQAERKAAEKAAADKAAAEKKAAKELKAAEKKAAKDKAAAEKKAAKELKAAEKKASKEKAAAEKKATKSKK